MKKIVLLLLLILFLYGKMLSYPYIQDDWHHLNYFYSTGDRTGFLDYCSSFFIVPDDSFYRPLAKMYFYFIIHVFDNHPIAFRLLDVVLVLFIAIVSQKIAFHLLKNESLAWIAASWIAFSATILMDPLMWLVGIYDLGGTLFFLLSILLFMKNKYWTSAASYLIAVLFKEGTLLLPFILVLYSLFLVRKSYKGTFQNILPHGILFLIYSLFRYETLLSGVKVSRPNAYEMDFWGGHVFTNIFKYLIWTLEGLTGLANLHENKVNLLLILLTGVLFLFIFFKRRAVFSKLPKNSRLILFLFVWSVLCITPVLFLPNHAYRYYLIYSYPAVIILVVYFLSLAFRDRTILVVLTLLFISNVITVNVILGKGLRAPRLSGSNVLAQRGETVKLMLSYVHNQLPNIPKGTVFVFDGVDYRTRPFQGIDPVAFQGKNFLRYVYRDPSIDAINLRGNVYAKAKRKLNLVPEKTVVLGLKNGKINRYPIESLNDTHSAFYSDPKL